MSWIPLGPRDVYVPSKNVSPRYLRNVNIANTAITNNAYLTNVARDRVRDIRYANRDVPGAVTTVPRTAFTAPRPGSDAGVDRRFQGQCAAAARTGPFTATTAA